MVDGVRGLPLSRAPLIGEARRRARQRRALVAVAAVSLVAGGGAAAAILSSSSSGAAYVPTRPSRAAVAASVGDLIQPRRSGRTGVWVPEPWKVQVRGLRTPLPRFAVMVFLRNGSGEPVTLEHVGAVVSAASRLRQIGARVGLLVPGVCITGPCYRTSPGVDAAAGPFGAERFSPLRIPPGQTAQGQLNFEIRACTSRPRVEAVSVRRITVVYRLPQGTEIRQHVALKEGLPQLAVNPASPRTGALLPSGRLGNAGAVDFGAITTRACSR